MQTQYLQTAAGKIAFDDSGEGPLLICVPGIGDLRQEYRYLAPQLIDAGYRVVTMDIRGHGETSTTWDDFTVAGVGADILALARHFNSGPVVILGSSMAAGAAVWAAAEAPDAVSALVLLGPSVHGDVSWQMRLLINVLFARPWGPAAWAKYFTTLFPTRKPGDLAEYTAQLKHNLSQAGRVEALKKMSLASKKASAERLAQVNSPSLTLMGSKDPDFKDPPAEAAWVAAQLKGRYEVIDGAGHYPQTEFTEQTGQLLLDFLASLQLEVNYAATVRG